ncbi:MAG: CHASE domain-containing protein, partial [Betaproteobacteria bacterium]
MAYLLLVLAYVASGKLGLMLALPPGYVSAIFPPAGIAVAAVLIGKRGALPWVFLGSLLLNLWVSYGAGRTGIGAAAIIATASMLQAAAGGFWLRRLIGYPAPLDNFSDLMRFLLSAPVICLTSSTLSVAGLWGIGMIASASLMTSWGTWWIGDTLGVLVMLPLVMVLAGEPRGLWRSRLRTVAVPMMLAFALFVLSFVQVNRWEREDSLLTFRLLSQQVVSDIQARFEEQSSLLEQLDGLFRASDQVTRLEFHRFVEKSLVRFPMIQAVEWAPQVELPRRAGFEKAQRADLRGFEIRERDSAGRLQRAGMRDRYYPVSYVEPLAGNEAVAGFDLASTPHRQLAMAKSMETGAIVATPPVRLVQAMGAEREGGLLMLALLEGMDSPGVVLTVLKMDSFMEGLLPAARDSLCARFDDLDDGQTLYDSFPGKCEGAVSEHRFEFGTRHYRLQTAPTSAYLARHQGWQSWGALVIGILGTGLLGSLLLLGTGYTARAEALVVERTARLTKSEAQLTEAQRMAHTGSWELDLEQDSLVWSDEIFRIFEMDPMIFGASYDAFLALVHPEDRELVDRTYTESVKNGTSYDIEHRLLFPDGRIKYVREHCETFYDAEGRPVRSAGTV